MHVYETNGDWLVTMTVSDPMGCLDPQSTDISISIADPPSPTVDQVELFVMERKFSSTHGVRSTCLASNS